MGRGALTLFPVCAATGAQGGAAAQASGLGAIPPAGGRQARSARRLRRRALQALASRYTAAAAAYETAAPAQLRRGYEAMRYYSRLLAQRYGTRGGWLADKVIGLIPACRELRGVILRREPAPESRECGDRILELFHSEVPAAAAHLREFMASVSTGAPLSAWFDRDFNVRSGANCGQGRS